MAGNWWDQLGTGLGDALVGINQPFGMAPPAGYDRQAAIRQGALQLGTNILANPYATPMEAVGKGFQNAQAQGGDRALKAMQAQQMLFDMDERKRKKAQEDERKAIIERAMQGLPPDQLALAQADPEGFFKQKIEQTFAPPKPPTFDTVTTEEGVFRISDTDPNTKIKIGERPTRNEGEGRSFTQEGKLRDSFIKQSKPFEDLRVNYQRINAAYDDAVANPDNPGAADIAMVYSYMKMLDPTSVVREGEFATAQTAGGVPEQVIVAYNRLLKGDRLAPEIRDAFLRQSTAQFEQQMQSYEQTRKVYEDLALQYELDPRKVVPDLTYGVKPRKLSPGAPGKTDLKSKYGLE